MVGVKNILICGIGAVGSIFAAQIQENGANLKVLVDEGRLKRYKENPPMLNGKTLEFDYILPGAQDFKADLIIIATKFTGLDEAVENVANFVGENTIIMSLLNGVMSEEVIAAKYGWEHVLCAYFIGHSAMRVEHEMTSGGVNVIVFGSPQQDDPKVARVKEFFDSVGIQYKIPDDIMRSLWLKLTLNAAVNQLSAVFGMTFGQMVCNEKFLEMSKKIMKEVAAVAAAQGIANAPALADEAFKQLSTVASPNGKTSMLQDVEACRKTEVDIFSGTVTEFGAKHNVPTPYNQILKEMIEVIEANYDA